MSISTPSNNAIKRAHWFALPLIAILIGIVLRVIIRSSSLWQDEIIAATQSAQSIPHMLVHMFLYDLHPPLYFIELHFWSYASRSDFWLIANSVIFGIAAVASIFFVVRKLKTTQEALITTAVFSVLPVAIWMAGEVRMYAMLSLLFVWLYYFTYKAFALPEGTRNARLAIIVLSIAIIYTHAIGFVAVFFYGIYAISFLLSRRASSRDWFVWLIVFGITGIAALPVALNDIVRPADMAPVGGIKDIGAWLSSVITGTGYKTVPWLYPAGLITFLITAIAGTITASTRRITLCFLVAPILFCLLLEITLRPLFKTDFFANFYSPFLALVIGGILSSLPLKNIARTIVMFCAFAALLTMAVGNRLALNASDAYFSQTAKLIATEGKRGDVVWTANPDILWGLARYMVGPDWGVSPAMHDPLRPGSGWWKIFNKISPEMQKKLGLIPTVQSVTTPQGIVILNSTADRLQAAQAKRLFVATYTFQKMPENDFDLQNRKQAYSFPPIQMNFYEKRQ